MGGVHCCLLCIRISSRVLVHSRVNMANYKKCVYQNTKGEKVQC